MHQVAIDGQFLAPVPAELVEKVLEQERDVLDSLAQGRDGDGHHVEPVVEILAKGALADLFEKIFMGGADQPDIHRDDLDAADPGHPFFLDDPQQHGLLLERHVADLVEKQGAAVGQLELAGFAAPACPGKGAVLVAEQLAAYQFPGDCPAVEGNERRGLAPALVMDGLGKNLLAGARLALEQHVGSGLRREFGQFDRLLHLPAFADDVVELQRGGIAAEAMDQMLDRLDRPQGDVAAGDRSPDRLRSVRPKPDTGTGRCRYRGGFLFPDAAWTSQGNSFSLSVADEQPGKFDTLEFRPVSANNTLGCRVQFRYRPVLVKNQHAVGDHIEKADQFPVSHRQLVILHLDPQLGDDRLGGGHHHAEGMQMRSLISSRRYRECR